VREGFGRLADWLGDDQQSSRNRLDIGQNSLVEVQGF
jgi:hypothetical protein